MTRPRFLPILVLVASVALGACGPKEDTPPTSISADPTVQRGQELAKSRGCTSCHSPDGKTRSGPTFKGLAGSQVQLANGQTVTADDEYLRNAITDPDAQVRKGYHEGVMSAAMRNQKDLSTDDVNAIVAYIKELR